MEWNFDNVKYNGKDLDRVQVDGVTVWEKAKPKFYEYLQNDGVAYINTNVYGYMNHRYELIYQFVDNSNGHSLIFGTRLGVYSGQNMSMTYGETGYSTLYWNSQTSGAYRVNLGRIDTTKHTLIIDNGVVNYDGVDKGTSAGHNSNFSIQNNIYLFAINANANGTPYCGQAKIYEFKDYDSLGNLIRDMVPCEYKGEYGLWDLVNNKFYGNANSSGAFTVGSEIQYYDYLENDGVAYIDTEIYGSGNISTELIFKNIGSANRFICGGTGNYTPVIVQSNNWFNTRYTNVEDSNATTVVLTQADHNDHTIRFNFNNSIVWDGVEYASNLSIKNDTKPLYLFSSSTTQYTATARIYYCKIYNNGTLVRDFKPCLYNNQAGLWDSVECKFYGNANNTGTLTVGNDG